VLNSSPANYKSTSMCAGSEFQVSCAETANAREKKITSDAGHDKVELYS